MERELWNFSDLMTSETVGMDVEVIVCRVIGNIAGRVENGTKDWMRWMLAGLTELHKSTSA